jgi:hypothetical protein
MAVAVTLVTATVPTSGQTAAPSSHLQLLDVPYVSQSEALCGGAAVAMVMRYWGATGIHAESFASLVDHRAKGIRAADLLLFLTGRGWTATSVEGTPALVARSLEARRPAIAMIEVRPDRFHFVVIVSWAAGKVIVHDPARRPFEVHDEQAFLRAWRQSGYWTLVALPPAAGAVTRTAVPEAPLASGGRCGDRVDTAVRQANSGEIEQAATALEQAAAQCPGEAAPWRELAGIHAIRKDWARAATDARRALAIDSRDQHAARILATSLYVTGDSTGALAAWNLVGEPTVDLVDVRGLDRTRYSVAVRALRLPTEVRLTPDRLTRAARRLDSVPSIMGSSVTYTPRDDGLAQITAAVIERPVLPTTPLAAGAMAIRAAVDRELQLDVVSPTGGAERWFATWRWWEARPRVSVGVEAPAPFGGILHVSATDERESFGVEPDTYRERRRGVSAGVSDWISSTMRWEVELRGERWPAGSSAVGALAALRYQSLDDRITVAARAGVWSATAATWTAGAFSEWRSRAPSQGTVWLGRVSLDAAGAGTPLGLWSGAGTGQGRSGLLRAHPLLHDGVIGDAVFGRLVASGGAEWRRWSAPIARVLRIAPAAFVDVARAYEAPAFADPRAHVDVGAGLRLALPGAGVLRADLARGLRDGRVAVSFGWVR